MEHLKIGFSYGKCLNNITMCEIRLGKAGIMRYNAFVMAGRNYVVH